MYSFFLKRTMFILWMDGCVSFQLETVWYLRSQNWFSSFRSYLVANCTLLFWEASQTGDCLTLESDTQSPAVRDWCSNQPSLTDNPKKELLWLIHVLYLSKLTSLDTVTDWNGNCLFGKKLLHNNGRSLPNLISRLMLTGSDIQVN